MVVPAPKQVNEGRQWGYSAWARLLLAPMGIFGVGAVAVQTLHPGADAVDFVGNLT